MMLSESDISDIEAGEVETHGDSQATKKKPSGSATTSRRSLLQTADQLARSFSRDSEDEISSKFDSDDDDSITDNQLPRLQVADKKKTPVSARKTVETTEDVNSSWTPKSRPASTTPKSALHAMSTRELMIKIYERQDDILSLLRNTNNGGVSQKPQHTVVVPPAVKNAVRQGYKDGQEKGLSWIFDDGKRVCDAVNGDMTNHIKNFVKGWNPSFNDPTVLNQALNRYFTTKKQEKTNINKDKLELEKKKRASHERKKEKAKRRIFSLEKMDLSAIKKAQIRSALEAKYMSSDEECDDGFISHPPSWESAKLTKYKRKLDSNFLDVCSTKSRRLLSKRTIGEQAIKAVPVLKNENLNWILKEK